MDGEQTFVYALEIEQALVSVLWRKVTLMECFLARCDPMVHLSQPKLRIIVRAIQLAYGELGADLNCEINPLEGSSDWPVVVTVVRELGGFDECGGLAGLNEVYSAHEPTPYSSQIFGDYLRLVCDYALARQEQSAPRVCVFSGGRGTLYLNKAKKARARDDFKGEAIVQGARYQVSADFPPRPRG